MIIILSTQKKEKSEVSKLPFIEFQADPIYINQIKEWYNENLGQDYHATITVDQVATCKEMLVSGVGYDSSGNHDEKYR